MARPFKLGEILVQLGYLTPQRLEAVLMHQRQWGVSLGRAAVAKSFCTEQQVLDALSRQIGLPVIDLDKEEISDVHAALLPQKDAERHHAVPIRLAGARGEVLVVAMAAPASLSSQDALLAVTKKSRLQVYLATDEAVHRAIGRVYRGDQYSPISAEMMMGPRELVIDPATFEGGDGQPPAAPAPSAPPPAPGGAGQDPVAALALSPDCRKVIAYGAEVRKVSPRQMVERVLEDWAARQLQAWAKSAVQPDPGKKP